MRQRFDRALVAAHHRRRLRDRQLLEVAQPDALLLIGGQLRDPAPDIGSGVAPDHGLLGTVLPVIGAGVVDLGGDGFALDPAGLDVIE